MPLNMGQGLASAHVARWLQKTASNPCLRHPATGEGPPLGENYHKAPIPDEDWWLCNNDRSKLLTDGSYSYYDPNPLGKKSFKAQHLPKDEGRVRKQLGRQGHSFSESNLKVLKEDEGARRYMAQKYKELMGHGQLPTADRSLSPKRQRSCSRPPADDGASAALRESSIDTAGQGIVGVDPQTGEALDSPPLDSSMKVSFAADTEAAIQSSPQRTRPTRGRSAGRVRPESALRRNIRPERDMPKLPTRDEVPKSELRRTMTGARMVLLPNPRIGAGGGIDIHADIHSPMPKRHARAKSISTFDCIGERMIFQCP
eukprot:TRINITY_DN38029_c0_g1_i2.p1 TRINITY_DN38029_c0_g1~~TRINITY_DN38029_c0_g1_i2.p1  ORF type:complete len:314 (+),score=41.10 TRINITY_DN38029_c0_g1_i2:90-1031(+)